ncbi:unnamed protein product [Lupinus luteus]|uniref:Homeobox-leucine zipper protein n=1 Tax=Lupinus luteus TaxID=3873 RepID=A0AAV1WTN1_LUPLU
MQLARALGLQPRQVTIWFQNRRAQWKTKQLEKDYDLLKSQYDVIKEDNDALQVHNQKLQSEIHTKDVLKRGKKFNPFSMYRIHSQTLLSNVMSTRNPIDYKSIQHVLNKNTIKPMLEEIPQNRDGIQRKPSSHISPNKINKTIFSNIADF